MEIPQNIQKITIIFPPGDQLTSLLISKEGQTVIKDLLTRLCTLRAIEFDLNQLVALNDLGNEVDLSQTVLESKLEFIEIVEKKELKKEKKKVKDSFTNRGLPSGVKLTVGEYCTIPFEQQLFDDEKKALQEFKEKNEQLCQSFTDEYIMACLFARKMDQSRTLQLLQNSYKFRKENNFMKLPKFTDIDKEIWTLECHILGSRDKGGRCIRYFKHGFQPGVPPYTIENIKRLYVWFFFVGIYAEGMDALRNGFHMVMDMNNVTWKHIDVDMMKQISPLFDTFPFLVRRGSIMNAPPIVNAILKIMRTVMKAKIVDRMRVKKPSRLMKIVDKDNLWNIWGGDVEWSLEKFIGLMGEWAEKNHERLAKPLV